MDIILFKMNSKATVGGKEETVKSPTSLLIVHPQSIGMGGGGAWK